MNSFANTIRSKRKSLGLTQHQLAKKINFDVTYLSKLENKRNDYPPSEELLHKLAFHLNLEYNELLISSGRIESSAYLLFCTLAEKYSQFIPFMQKINQDSHFAQHIFKLLEENESEI
ncbi:transcriptional regulator, XRE family (plasmid) [Calothrix sp. PCC 7716]|nr:transcriptional regulator, XRE family [Calothrix sp. PCC 7716]